jgi:hypothetical protein
MKRRKKYNLSLDPEVMEPLHERLRQSNISLSGYVNAVLAESWDLMRELPVNVEDMTVKQFTEFLNKYVSRMKE